MVIYFCAKVNRVDGTKLLVHKTGCAQKKRRRVILLANHDSSRYTQRHQAVKKSTTSHIVSILKTSHQPIIQWHSKIRGLIVKGRRGIAVRTGSENGRAGKIIKHRGRDCYIRVLCAISAMSFQAAHQSLLRFSPPNACYPPFRCDMLASYVVDDAKFSTEHLLSLLCHPSNLRF